MSERFDNDRRRLLGTAATTLAAASLGVVTSAVAETPQGTDPTPGAVPTITIASDFDGPAADGSGYAKLFSGKYSHRVLKGIGHNMPQEAPEAFARAVIDVAGYSA